MRFENGMCVPRFRLTLKSATTFLSTSASIPWETKPGTDRLSYISGNSRYCKLTILKSKERKKLITIITVRKNRSPDDTKRGSWCPRIANISIPPRHLLLLEDIAAWIVALANTNLRTGETRLTLNKKGPRNNGHEEEQT